MTAVGVDVGGTNITAAAVSDGQVTDRAKVATPQGDAGQVVGAVCALVERLSPDETTAVGVGVPGAIRDGVVALAPNLGWGRDVSVAAMLEERLGPRVVVGNDATLGTYGEWMAGAGRGHDDLLGVWLGTGVGSGIVLDGRLLTRPTELGHVTVERDGSLCACGRRGCAEAYAGRASLEAAARRAVAAGEPSLLDEIATERGRDRYTAGVWAAAIEQGDLLAVRLWDAALDALSDGVRTVMLLLDVRHVVLGGGMADKLGEKTAAGLRDRLSRTHGPAGGGVDIALATLGDDAGVVGAALYAARSGEL